MMKTYRYMSITVAAFLMLALSTPAFAYLDPGTGSALLQGILAALAAIAVTAKLYWHRLLRLLGLKKGRSGDHTEKSAETEPQPGSSRSDEEPRQ